MQHRLVNMRSDGELVPIPCGFTSFQPVGSGLLRPNWLMKGFLSSVVGLLLIASPAEAGKLQSWSFDANQNRLEFRTDSAVQPQAQLIDNPTRLVIDLPNVVLGRSQIQQTVAGKIRTVRIGQFNRQTTRIVVELPLGYTLDPNQVRFRGVSDNYWTVQIPAPQRSQTSTEPSSSSSGINNPSSENSGSPEVQSNTTPSSSPSGINSGTQLLPISIEAATTIEKIRVTSSGLFIQTEGVAPPVTLEADDNAVNVQLRNTRIDPEFTHRNQIVGRFGVRRLKVTQVQVSPPIAQVTLTVDSTSTNWQATATSLGGIALVPTKGGGTSTVSVSSQPRPAPLNPATPSILPTDRQEPITIEAIDLSADESQLLIRTNGPLADYDQGWDRRSAAYRVSLPGARLSEGIERPRYRQGGPLLRVRLRQEDNQAIAILLDPAKGVRIGELNQVSNTLLALSLQRPVVNPPSTAKVTPAPKNPSLTLPTLPPSRGRQVVIIDPGHGGPDPGAIGIGGLREKDLVLPISIEVAKLLEQQGVQVILTRDRDIDLDLEPRVRLAERSRASVFVSIHANAINLGRPDVNGVETYYYTSGDGLARTIHNSILGGLRARDRGVRRARFYVLRKTSMPAVLVEIGFVTGREDAANLSKPAYRSQMAAAIARGILQYMKQ